MNSFLEEYFPKEEILNEGEGKKITFKEIRKYADLIEERIQDDDSINSFISEISENICKKIGLDPEEEASDDDTYLAKVATILYPNIDDQRCHQIANDLNDLKLLHSK
jgi:hypothetical protein